jgi:hypothetical protein
MNGSSARSNRPIANAACPPDHQTRGPHDFTCPSHGGVLLEGQQEVVRRVPPEVGKLVEVVGQQGERLRGGTGRDSPEEVEDGASPALVGGEGRLVVLHLVFRLGSERSLENKWSGVVNDQREDLCTETSQFILFFCYERPYSNLHLPRWLALCATQRSE